jgi:hypothetical protein
MDGFEGSLNRGSRRFWHADDAAVRGKAGIIQWSAVLSEARGPHDVAPC